MPSRGPVLWLRSNASLLVVAASLAIVLILAGQNLHLRNQAAQSAADLDRLERLFRFNLELGKYLGRSLPELLGDPSEFAEERPSASVVIVFNPTVCGRCLKEGLRILAEHQPRIEQLGFGPFAVVGETGTGTRVSLAKLRESKLLAFRSLLVKAEQIERSLPFVVGSAYIDEPIFFFIDSNRKIVQAFKPDCRRMENLRHWLGQLLSESHPI